MSGLSQPSLNEKDRQGIAPISLEAIEKLQQWKGAKGPLINYRSTDILFLICVILCVICYLLIYFSDYFSLLLMKQHHLKLFDYLSIIFYAWYVFLVG